jgi:hypothetical protein
MGINNDLLFNLQGKKFIPGKLFFKMLDLPNITNMPCLLNAKYWETGANEVEVRFPFPRYMSTPINERTVYRRENVRAADKKSFLDKNRFKVIEAFDFDQISRLQSYVERNDIITFQLWNKHNTAYGYDKAKTAQKNALAFLNFLRSLFDMLTSYKYNSCEYVHINKDYLCSNPADVEYYLTFMSLFTCIPTFNRKKMDGMGLIVNMVDTRRTEDRGQLFSLGHMALLMTNHKENKYVIDGVNIYDPHPLQMSTLENFVKYVERNAKVKPENKSRAKEVKKSNNSAEYFYVSSPTWHGSSTSSAITYT